jgi:hypothetical protein
MDVRATNREAGLCPELWISASLILLAGLNEALFLLCPLLSSLLNSTSTYFLKTKLVNFFQTNFG